MEACTGAHHWGKILCDAGYQVKIVPPQFVKPFVKSNKNDANDAQAISEAMARLGVPTTRALAAVTTGEQVARQELLPGGVITRVAASFVRVGTFEYFSSRGDLDAVTRLADYVIEHNYPDCRGNPQPYRAWLEAVIDRQAALIARWMQLGFIHGVMNTDNMSIAGESIDYGPCAFMDAYHPDRVYSSIDRGGRYAYGNQPRIAHWNLSRLAQTLLPIIDQDQTRALEEAQADVMIGHDTGCVTTLDKNQWIARAAGKPADLPVLADCQFAALVCGAHPYKIVQSHWHASPTETLMEKLGIDWQQKKAEFEAYLKEVEAGNQENLYDPRLMITSGPGFKKIEPQK